TTTLESSTIANNIATTTGGALYNAAATNSYVYALDTTIAGNVAETTGGGLFTDASADNKVYALNSILYGNYQGTVANDLYFNNGTTKTFYNAYSIFGTSNINPDSATMVESTQFATNQTILDRIFDKVELDDSGRWIAKLDDNGRTITIHKTGEAAIEGTLVGKLGDDYYFFNIMNQEWQSFTTATKVDFVGTPPQFGLGDNATIYNAGQNLSALYTHVPRAYATNEYRAFNVGAYVIDDNFERPNLIVTTNEDIINPYDGLISLREALAYAANGVLLDFEDTFNFKPEYHNDLNQKFVYLEDENTPINIDKTTTIIFCNRLFQDGLGNVSTNDITLTMSTNSENITYEELRITNNLSNTVFMIYGGVRQNETNVNRNVTVKVPVTYKESVDNGTVATNYRVFQTGVSYDEHTNWDITFFNLTIKGGEITDIANQGGHGGSFYAHGNSIDLKLYNFTVAESKAVDGGGMYLYSTGSRTIHEGTPQEELISSKITMRYSVAGSNQRSLVENNVATNHGGGIWNYGAVNSTIILDNTTINKNIATNNGGGIWSTGVTNSNITFTKTRITNNEAGVDGGGIYSYSNATSTITGTQSVILHNTATSDGGGIFSEGITANSTITIKENSYVSGNTATNGHGGGIYSYSRLSSVVNVLNSIFGILEDNVTAAANTAKVHGGAIYSVASNYNQNDN
ncbi:MAG TPA: hypothetical protein PLR86_09995, partial [Planctomycetota bacterium]|nr:hypothetical protein [Planctomycetota bacterium]